MLNGKDAEMRFHNIIRWRLGFGSKKMNFSQKSRLSLQK